MAPNPIQKQKSFQQQPLRGPQPKQMAPKPIQKQKSYQQQPLRILEKNIIEEQAIQALNRHTSGPADASSRYSDHATYPAACYVQY
jgi:hypothetical protein